MTASEESTGLQKKILIIDDEESIRRTLSRLIKKVKAEGHTASGAEEARRILERETFDLVLCDIIMPGESGLDLAVHIRSHYPETALIMVTGIDEPEVVEKALELGAYGYIVKPFKISEVIINISSALRRQKLEIENRIYQRGLEQLVEERTAKLQKTLYGIIGVVGKMVETRDPYTAGHQRRVAELAGVLAEKMGLSRDRQEGLKMAASIHDLGKISVPAQILTKPGGLTALEFEIIKGHPQVGFDILREIEFPWPIALAVFQHHERMDGSGYPLGLKGEEIALEPRILAVADVVEAMVSHRPYREALGLEAALEEISSHAGSRYDPEVVQACKHLLLEDGFCLS